VRTETDLAPFQFGVELQDAVFEFTAGDLEIEIADAPFEQGGIGELLPLASPRRLTCASGGYDLISVRAAVRGPMRAWYR
jgi:hypothetical protein